MILKSISLYLNNVLNADDKYLPLTAADSAKLLAHVPDGESTFLTISDESYKEYVRVDNTDGTLILTRGIDSDAHKFPKGSCVYFENSLPVTKWLICNYECCTGDCPVDPVVASGFVLPKGKVGNAWEGSFVFSGDLPIQYGITGLPAWLNATWEGNYVKLSGVPTASGYFTISVAASNDRGSNIAIQQGTIDIES